MATGAVALPQMQKPVIPLHTLNHMTLHVSDVQRSLEFYQGLFGLPVQARQGPTVVLRIGEGPQFVALAGTSAAVRPSIGHFCATTAPFVLSQILDQLAAHGIMRSENSAPLSVRVRIRREKDGGSPEGTPEVYVSDPDGSVVQLQHTSYCGGPGALGEGCSSVVENAPRLGLMPLVDYRGFTLRVKDERRTRQFYESIFALAPLRPGSSMYRIGPGKQTISIVQSAGDVAAQPVIWNVSLLAKPMKVAAMEAALRRFGCKRQAGITPNLPPLSYALSEDGGQSGVDLADPDGVLLRLRSA